MNSFKGLDLVNRVPEELWTEVHSIVQEAVNKTSPKQKKKKSKKAVVEELEKLGLLVKIEDYSHNVGFCYRHGNTPVEPRLSEQWFVKMKPLAKAAIDVVKDGRVKFVPDRFTKTYLNWMENVHIIQAIRSYYFAVSSIFTLLQAVTQDASFCVCL